MGIIVFLIVGLIAGWLAEQVMKRGHGLATNLVVGVAGAFLGGLLFRIIGLSATHIVGSIIVATVGAVALLFILDVVAKRR